MRGGRSVGLCVLAAFTACQCVDPPGPSVTLCTSDSECRPDDVCWAGACTPEADVCPRRLEVCDNGKDDDCDNAGDCDDSDCHGECASPTGSCSQGQVLCDGAPGECYGFSGCEVDGGCLYEALVGRLCSTGRCRADGQCVSSATEWDCANGKDDDLDVGVDCADSDCASQSCDDQDACTLGERCQGGVCAGGTVQSCNSPPGECFNPTGLCGAKRCIYTPKPGGQVCDGGWGTCNLAGECRQPETGTACSDGTDNDGNGLADCADPSCSNAECSTGPCWEQPKTCQQSACAGGVAKCLTAPNACLTAPGSCHPTSGACTYTVTNVGGPCGDSGTCLGDGGCRERCSTDGWCRVDSPVSPFDWLLDVSGTSATDVWAVGNGSGVDGGVTAHWNGTSWTVVPNPLTVDLNGVWANGPTDVWAVGEQGAIAHYTGSWNVVTSPVTMDLYAVRGVGQGRAWAVGNAGTIVRYDGASWTPFDAGYGSFLSDVWGNTPNSVWVVGMSIRHWNGSAWSTEATPGQSLSAVFGLSATDVWAAGTNNTLWHYDGTNWSSQNTGANGGIYQDLWGTNGTNVWVVAYFGQVAHWNGASWSGVLSGTHEFLFGVWGSSATDVWAVGDHGTLLRYPR